MIPVPFVVLLVIAAVFVAVFLCGWLAPALFDPRPKPKPERIRPEVGGCGVHGCSNKRPHSHVDALIKRLKEKR